MRSTRRLQLLGRVGRAVREEDDAPHALQPGRALHAAARPVEALRRHQPDHDLGQLELAARSRRLRLRRHPLRLGLARSWRRRRVEHASRSHARGHTSAKVEKFGSRPLFYEATRVIQDCYHPRVWEGVLDAVYRPIANWARLL